MKDNTLIYVGLGLIGLYLFTKPKATTVTTLTPGVQPAGNTGTLLSQGSNLLATLTKTFAPAAAAPTVPAAAITVPSITASPGAVTQSNFFDTTTTTGDTGEMDDWGDFA